MHDIQQLLIREINIRYFFPRASMPDQNFVSIKKAPHRWSFFVTKNNPHVETKEVAYREPCGCKAEEVCT